MPGGRPGGLVGRSGRARSPVPAWILRRPDRFGPTGPDGAEPDLERVAGRAEPDLQMGVVAERRSSGLAASAQGRARQDLLGPVVEPDVDLAGHPQRSVADRLD